MYKTEPVSFVEAYFQKQKRKAFSEQYDNNGGIETYEKIHKHVPDNNPRVNNSIN